MGESLSLTLSARLKQALVRQQAEFDSDYATTNLPLTSLIDDSTDPQVFRAAADLLADPRVGPSDAGCADSSRDQDEPGRGGSARARADRSRVGRGCSSLAGLGAGIPSVPACSR